MAHRMRWRPKWRPNRGGAFYFSMFTMDGLPRAFPGYTDGSTWNGWSVPYFNRYVSIRILEELRHGDDFQWTYDAETDSFIIVEPNMSQGDSYVVAGKEIAVEDGRTLILYGIGAEAYTWYDPEELRSRFAQ